MGENATLTLEGLKSTFDSQKSDIAKMLDDGKKVVEAHLSDWESKIKAAYKIDGGEWKPAEVTKPESKKAELADIPIVGGFMDFKIMEVPIGQAAIGGAVAIFASELVDGFLTSQSVQVKGVVKLGGAFVAIKWGKGLLGANGSKVVALLLTFDALRDLTPIDTWAAQLASRITGLLPARGLAGQDAIQAASKVRMAQWQANQVATNYYSKAFGR